MFRLQQQAGNQAVLGLLRFHGIQPKLAISQPGDPDEREADQVADRVMRAHAGGLTGSSCSCDGEGEQCEKCQHQQAATIARKVAPSTTPAAPHDAVEPVLRSSGEPMDPSTRAFFEPRFGRDFSRVRVHTGAGAGDSTRAIEALAYTTANHMVFREGLYQPRTETGQRLIAHELTHVVQQGASSPLQPQSAHGLDPKVHKTDEHFSTHAFFEPRSSSEDSDFPSVFHRQPENGNAGKAPGFSLSDLQFSSAAIEIPALLARYTKLKLRAPQIYDAFEHTAWMHQVDSGTFVLVDLTQPEAIENDVPLRTLVEPQVPTELRGSLRERMWPLVSDTAPAAEDVSAEILGEIAFRWAANNQALLDSMVRIRLVEKQTVPAAPNAQNPIPLKVRPVLEFDIEGEPIRTTDGSLPLLDLDPLGSNDLESIVSAVQSEATIIAQAGDLYRASQQVVAGEIDWWNGASSNWDRVSKEEVDAHAQIFSFDLNTTPIKTPLGLSVVFFLNAYPEYSDVLGELGSQVLALQQQVDKYVNDFEQYFNDPARRSELYTFKQGKAEVWKQAREMWDEGVGEGTLGYVEAGLTSGLYSVMNTLSAGYLDTRAQGVEAWEAGHISMDQLNALSEAAELRGVAVGVVTVAVTLATVGLAGPAAGTAVSLGQKALTAGFVGFASTLSGELTGTGISAAYNFKDPTTQAIWKEGVHSPGQILFTSAAGGALGAASVPAGVIFGKMVSAVRGAFRTAQAAAPEAGTLVTPAAAAPVPAEAPEIAAGGDLAEPSATAAVDEAAGELAPVTPTTPAAPIPNLQVPGWEVEPLGDGTYRLTRPDIPGEVIVTSESIRYQVPAGTGMMVVGEVPVPEESVGAPGQIAAETRPALPPSAAEGAQRVWVNRGSGVYHLPGSRWYGATANGEYMSLAQAEAAGFRRAGVPPRSGVYSVTRPPGGDIRIQIKAWIQGRQARGGFEREMASAAEYGLEEIAGMERGHTTGAGLGAEAREAIRLETRFVNQQLKKNGVERTIREILPMLEEGDRLHLTTATHTHPGTLRLKMVEYRLELVRANDETEIILEASIEQGLSGKAVWQVEQMGSIAQDLAPSYSGPRNQ